MAIALTDTEEAVLEDVVFPEVNDLIEGWMFRAQGLDR